MAFFNAEGNCPHLREALKILVITDSIALQDNRSMCLDKPSQPMAPEERAVLSTSSTSTSGNGRTEKHVAVDDDWPVATDCVEDAG